jgi:hypothetical protein
MYLIGFTPIILICIYIFLLSSICSVLRCSVSAGSLLCIAIVLQLSLTHGYLPYGSSDVLVRQRSATLISAIMLLFLLLCM